MKLSEKIDFCYRKVVTSYTSFFFWRKKRFTIENWFNCWVLSSILGTFFVYGLKKFIHNPAEYYFTVRFTNNMKLLFSLDMWNSIDGFMDVYPRYMNGTGIVIKKDDIVIDIGAHIGSFALPAFFDGAIIYSFEPDPKNMKILRDAIYVNAIPLDERFFLENAAVSCTSSIAEFSVGPTSTTGSLTKVGFFRTDAHSKKILCNTISLQDIFKKYGIKTCRLLKIDCEGCEYDVLYSSPPALLKKIQNIAMELHIVQGRSTHELKSYLEQLGFSVVTAEEHENGCWDLALHNTLYNIS
jgi:FkbM family methyltransferase